ncbi:U6 snRNA phosphodiesterase 1 isoform X2 [Lycorma delicatula]|uniref:U6 snRNA phosphodiesterase 1 isoform X2 n=1 Tax=Lycorma delicatula TaxID=130591 RepID=UPI003F50D982
MEGKNRISALDLISDYLSENDDSDTEEASGVSNVKERLPLPDAILKTSVQYVTDHVDDSSLHSGRIRSFPHQRGNWATYIYIPFNATDAFKSFCDAMIANAEQYVKLTAIPDPHISLTRTFVLLHHWIDSFVKSVEESLKYTLSFDLYLSKLSVYTNEDKTRTFFGLDVSTGYDELVTSVNIIDKCLKEFKLPTFYDDPSFHMSFAWCLGDQRKVLEERLPALNVYFNQFVLTHSEVFNMKVTHYFCKTGNKIFNFKLMIS